MSYDLALRGKYGTQQRHDEFDLGLSPREEFRLASEFPEVLRAMCMESRDQPNSLWTEVSAAARKRARIGDAPTNVLTLPTHAAIWPASRFDLRAREKWQQRDLTVAAPTGGGYLVATDNISFIELLRNRSVAFAMGATRMSGLVGNATIPKQTAGATAYWLSTEATAITEGNQVFAQLGLTPRTVGAYTEISRLLQLQSSPDGMSLIMSDLAKQVATAVDLAVIAGTGTEQPTGIIGTASVGTFTGTALASTALLDAQSDVASANALSASCGYVFTPAVAALLMARPELPSTGTERLWKGNMSEGTIFGFKAMTSMQMPTAKGIFGDWSQLVIGEWGVLEIAVNQAANFPAGITGLRAMFTVDCGVRYPGAFSITSSVT